MFTFVRPRGPDAEPAIAEVHRINPKTGKTSRKKIYPSWNKTDTTRFSELDVSDDEHQKLKFLPSIPKNQRFAAYVSGPSGSGKSTVIAEMVRDLKKQNGFPCYVFSAVEEFSDEAYKGLGVKHLKYKNKEALFKLTPEALRETNLIFDDFDSSLDPSINDFMQRLLISILEVSRKMKTQVIIVSHVTMGGQKTKNAIFECNTYCLFPSANRNSVLKFLSAYMDMSKSELEEIKQLDEGRYTRLFINKSIPRFWMSEQKLKMLE